MSKKKSKKRRQLQVISPYNGSVVKPFAVGGSKDAHCPVVLISAPKLTPSESTPQPHPPDVGVYVGDPPVFLLTVAEWQARDQMKRGEAELLFGNQPQRGIPLVHKPLTREIELGSGLPHYSKSKVRQSPVPPSVCSTAS